VVRILIATLLLATLLVPSVVAAPIECWWASETGKWTDWLWCGAVLVFMEVMQPGENGYYPGPG